MYAPPPVDPAAAFALFRSVCIEAEGRPAAVAERTAGNGWVKAEAGTLSLARGGALEIAGITDPVARIRQGGGRWVEVLAGGSTSVAPGATTLTCAMKFTPADPAAKAAVRAWLGPKAAELPMRTMTTFAALRSGDGFEAPPETAPTPEQLPRSVLVLVHESPEFTALTLMGYAR